MIDLIKRAKNIGLEPMAQQPGYASAASAINSLAAKREALEARKRQLEAMLTKSNPMGIPTFWQRATAALEGRKETVDVDACRAEHLEIRRQLEQIDAAIRAGHLELTTQQRAASQEARRKIAPRQREIVAKASAALQAYRAAVAEERELLNAATQLGYEVPTIAEAPHMGGDPADRESIFGRHLRDLEACSAR